MNFIKSKNRYVITAIDLIFFMIGSLFYAVAVDCFTAPNDIVLGGVTGVATVLSYLIDIPIGILIFIFNIPILLLGYKHFGKGYIKKVFFAIFLSSLFIDSLEPFLPVFNGDLLLASLYGGIFTGAGIGIIMLRGGSTGGVDIIAAVINKKFQQISVGRIMLYVDLLVVLFASIVYNNLEIALYAIITIYLSSKVVDSVLYGVDRAKVAMIVSEKSNEIYNSINMRLSRGGTFISSHGAYSGKEKNILLCAVRKNEIPRLRRLVLDTDKNAFFLILQADEIAGEGFTYDS